MGDGRRSINELLNTSTPYAPTSQEEVRARIESSAGRHQPPVPVPAADPPPDEITLASTVSVNQVTPPLAAEDPEIQADDGANADMADDGLATLLASLDEGLETGRRRLEEMAAASERAAARRFTSRDESGQVAVTVDGDGRLVSIDIHESALRGSHPQTIGPQVVHCLNQARIAAIGELDMPFLTTLLDGR